MSGIGEVLTSFPHGPHTFGGGMVSPKSEVSDHMLTNKMTKNASDAFEAAKTIWNDVALHRHPDRENNGKIREALKLFDEAIDSGYDSSEVYSLRGACLNELGFYYDALEDYNRAMQRNPEKGIASNYHMRSVVKDSLLDLDGSVSDLKEAVRLSKMSNADTRFWNDYAKKTGFGSATEFYEWCLQGAERSLAYEKTSPTSDADKKAKLETIRRRT